MYGRWNNVFQNLSQNHVVSVIFSFTRRDPLKRASAEPRRHRCLHALPASRIGIGCACLKQAVVRCVAVLRCTSRRSAGDAILLAITVQAVLREQTAGLGHGLLVGRLRRLQRMLRPATDSKPATMPGLLCSKDATLGRPVQLDRLWRLHRVHASSAA